MGPVTQPVTPEASSATKVDDSSAPELLALGANLKRLLNLSNEDYVPLLGLLKSLGFSEVEDVALLQEKDFDGRSSFSPAIQRKLLLVAEFVQRGGNITEVDDMKQLIQLVHIAKATQTPIIMQSSLSAGRAAIQKEEEIVHMDVGGHRFTTTRKTLCSIPNSALEAIFSGRHENAAHRTKDGTYVIDRDGSQFQHILNFLRAGAVVSLPREKADQDALAIEADFYGLDNLVHAIRMPKIDISECLSEEVLGIWHEEEKLRTAYRTKTADDLAPHQGLVPLFSPDDCLHSLPLTYIPSSKSESTVMDLRNYRNDKLKKGQSVTVKTLDDFRSSFNREHANVLHRLNDVLLEEPVIIAGGSVLKALTIKEGLRPPSWWHQGNRSDVDIFLYTSSPSEANRISQRIFFALAADNERWVIVRSRGVITIHRWEDGGRWNTDVDQKIQIVLRLYDSPAEVLVGFDCDCCCCAYDGREVWATPRCLLAIRSGTNILNPLHAWPNRPSYELRLAKYAQRGFSVSVAGLDKKRIDHDHIRAHALGNLKGLARLLKVSFAMEKKCSVARPLHPLENDDLKGDVVREMNDSDILVFGRGSYDDEIEEVIVPRVYGGGAPDYLMWQYGNAGEPSFFPLASGIRREAWSEIEDAGGTAASVERVPDRLLDAWDTDKRSREYLNAQSMDKFDLDNQYYDHAYEKSG